jgi:hypothetical protein
VKQYIIERYGSKVIEVNLPTNKIPDFIAWLNKEDRILHYWQPSKQEIDIEASKMCEEDDITELVSDIENHILDLLTT